jgi:cysteine desulfurase/selenocysteine lyase
MSLLPGAALRDHFPVFAAHERRGRPLIYLDNAATTQKPQAVIDAVADAMRDLAANVHRGLHPLGAAATDAHEGARARVADHLGCDAHEVVFVRNTTEALNLVARAWPRRGRVVTTLAEHHSNLLPWGEDQVTRLPPLADGTIDLEALARALERRDVALVSVSHISNVTGALTDVAAVRELAHGAGAALLLDCAQSAPSRQLAVGALGCDFLAFSGHKMCGPSGVGVLYARAERLDEIGWFLRGGGTVESVGIDCVAQPKPAPWRLEAGTPALEAAVGMAAALDFLDAVGFGAVEAHQRMLTRYAVTALRERLPSAQLVGPEDDRRSGAVSFHVRALPAHAIARLLGEGYGVCVRSGFHCAEPLHRHLRIPPTLRLSPYVYNTTDDIDRCLDAVAEVIALHTGRR